MRRLIPLSILLTSILIVAVIPGAMAAELDLEKDLLHALAGTRAIILKIVEQGQATQADLDQLQALVEECWANHLLLEERFRQREERARALGRQATNRHDEMRDAYHDALQEYLNLIEDFIAAEGDVGPRVFEQLKKLIDLISPKKRRPIFGSLPYRNLNYAPQEPPQEPLMIPAYRGGDKVVSPDDTKDTPEAPISPEIAALAESLDWSPVAIYEWVKNNIETEWYWGCMKGAEETLRQKSGNDCDQAALLVALLRASSFPARYVRGVIEFFPDIEIAKNLTGIADERELAAFFQKAGIPSKPVIAGGRIANFHIEHVWVEAYIPYANYRGAVIDEHGKTWLGLDTSIKTAGYTYNEPEAMPPQVSLADVRQGYLEGVHDETPLEYLKAQIEGVLPAGTGYEDLLATRELIPEALKILPASLQFEEIAVTGEYTQIPTDLMHKVRFRATGPNQTELFTVTVESFHLSNKSIALTYEPETVEDQEIINSWGGLDNTPSYLIHLRPVLTVDGERVGVGQDGLSVGQEYDLTLELISPNGTEQITNTHIIGNLAVMGICSQQAVMPEEIPFEEKDAQRLLFEHTISYIASWNQDEDEFASLMGLTLTRPVPTVVTLGGVVEVTYLLDTPHGFEWRGVYVDADLRTVEVASGYGQEASSEEKTIFMQLSGLEGSVLEHEVLQDAFQVASISTAKLFGLANTNGVPIITIDSVNIESLLPTLPFADNVKEDITDAVNQGLICRIPEAEMAYEDWTGIGYIKENPDTGEAGWMLSGMIAGGSTVQNILDWLEDLLYRFLYPDTEPPNQDPEAAYSIHKIYASDRQEGVVGEPLEKTLQVLVLDKDNNVVEGAEVTFIIKAGGGTLKDGETESQTTLPATTDRKGIAEVELILGEKTSDNPTMWWEEGYTYSQQVGENIVDVVLVSGSEAALTVPYVAYGFPDEETAKVKKLHGDLRITHILSFAGFVSVMVEDTYTNPISNMTVKFKAEDVNKECVSDDEDRLHALLVPVGDACMKVVPSHGTCSESPDAGDKIDVETSHRGAAVQIFTGAVPNAQYPIEATCDTAPVNKTVTFRLSSFLFGNCDDGELAPSSQFRITSVHRADRYGNNITAVPVATPMKFQARIYFLREGETEKEVTIECEENSGQCTKIVGSTEYSEDTEFETSSVTFTNRETGESNTADTPDPDGNGIFSGELTIKAGVNVIDITGEATAKAKKKWTQSGCDADNNIICNPMETDLEGEATRQTTVYGVAITTDPKVLIPIDEFGFTIADVPITYTIEPSEYQASTAYVVIVKDDEPFWYIPTKTEGTDTATLSRGFWFDLKSSYEAYVVLNPGSEVEIKSEDIQLDLAHIYLEKEDPDYSDVKLRWDDYYPPLGDKTIVIRGKDGKGNDLNSNKIKAEVVYPTNNNNVSIKPAEASEGITFKDGKVAVQLSAPNVAPPKEGDPVSELNLDRVKIKFTILSDDGKKAGELSGTWKIKNNYNTTLEEVLAGEAVFVFDTSNADNHKGETPDSVTEDGERKFDFVQELLNQVVPRKRSVGEYELLVEDGIYGTLTEAAVAIFKDQDHFKLDNSAINDDMNTFNKLKKDYGLTDSDRIIDKETLVGKILSGTDVLINGTSGSSDDTGLYELYDNVVKEFVEVMIEEAERYADFAVNYRARRNAAAGAIIQLQDNDGQVDVDIDDVAVSQGVSYSYGDIDTPGQFATVVNQPNIINWRNYTNGHKPGKHSYEHAYWSQGQQNPANFNATQWPYTNNWPPGGTIVISYSFDLLSPAQWGGIDCNGLVQRVINKADEEAQQEHLGANSHVQPLNGIGDKKPRSYFSEADISQSFDTDKKELIHKGDIVQYSGHISIVFSERWGESRYRTTLGTMYDIIHAYGANSYENDGNEATPPIFSRKVLITGENIGDPTGFGRIKLW